MFDKLLKQAKKELIYIYILWISYVVSFVHWKGRFTQMSFESNNNKNILNIEYLFLLFFFYFVEFYNSHWKITLNTFLILCKFILNNIKCCPLQIILIFIFINAYSSYLIEFRWNYIKSNFIWVHPIYKKICHKKY